VKICLPKPKILSKLEVPLKVLVKCPMCFHFKLAPYCWSNVETWKEVIVLLFVVGQTFSLSMLLVKLGPI
jgi:hypothetical protein